MVASEAAFIAFTYPKLVFFLATAVCTPVKTLKWRMVMMKKNESVCSQMSSISRKDPVEDNWGLNIRYQYKLSWLKRKC